MVFLTPFTVKAQIHRERIITAFDRITYFPDSSIHMAFTIKKGVPNGYAVEFNRRHSQVRIGKYKKGNKYGIWKYSDGGDVTYSKGDTSLIFYPGCGTGMKKARVDFQILFSEVLKCEVCKLPGKYIRPDKQYLVLSLDSFFYYSNTSHDTIFFSTGKWVTSNDTVFFIDDFANEKINNLSARIEIPLFFKEVHVKLGDFNKLYFLDNELFGIEENGKVSKRNDVKGKQGVFIKQDAPKYKPTKE